MSSHICRCSLLLLLAMLSLGCVAVPPFSGFCEGSYWVSDDWNPEQDILQQGWLGSNDLTIIAGCEIVEGSVTISTTNLTTLDDLSNLTSTGMLYIYANAALTNVDGLSSLTSMAGMLYIDSNAALTNVDGLSSLTSVNGDLGIYSNPVLCQDSVDAFIAGCTISGTVSTYDNDGACP